MKIILTDMSNIFSFSFLFFFYNNGTADFRITPNARVITILLEVKMEIIKSADFRFTPNAR
jgi:hypothetical protein